MKSIRSVSKETGGLVKKGDLRWVYSFLPIPHPRSEQVRVFVSKWQEKMSKWSPREFDAFRAKNKYVDFNPNAERYKKYEVYCKKCKAVNAIVYATDTTLRDWSHVYSVACHDNKYWYGGFTPQISRYDNRLAFECCCGNDSRDFRDKFDVSDKLRRENTRAREFGLSISKFVCREFRGGSHGG